VSAGAEAAGGDVTFTVATNPLTLGASRTLAAGDMFWVTGITEFDIGSTGDWQPEAGCECWVEAAGVHVKNGLVFWPLPGGERAGVDYTPSVFGRIEQAWTLAATLDDALLVGFYSTANTVIACGGIGYSAGNKTIAVYGTTSAPTFSYGPTLTVTPASDELTLNFDNLGSGTAPNNWRFIGGVWHKSANRYSELAGTVSTVTYDDQHGLVFGARQGGAGTVEAVFSRLGVLWRFDDGFVP